MPYVLAVEAEDAVVFAGFFGVVVGGSYEGIAAAVFAAEILIIIAVGELVEDDPGLVQGSFEEGFRLAEPGHNGNVRGFVAVCDEPAAMMIGNANGIVFGPKGHLFLHNGHCGRGDIKANLVELPAEMVQGVLHLLRVGGEVRDCHPFLSLKIGGCTK